MNYSPTTSRMDYTSYDKVGAFNEGKQMEYNFPSDNNTQGFRKTREINKLNLPKKNDDPIFEKYQEDKFRDRKDPNKDSLRNAKMILKGDYFKACDNPDMVDEVTKVYFSDENIERIQKMLKREIFERTKGEFKLDEDQDESDLLICMRVVLEDHARFLPFKIIRQVKELNAKTVEYIVPDMITQIKQNYEYIKEINRPISPPMRPLNVNNAGRRTLPPLTTAWGF